MRPATRVLSCAVMLAGACTDLPTARPSDVPLPPLLSELRCTATPATGELVCQSPPPSAGGASRTQLIAGGQHHYVRLTNGSPFLSGNLFVVGVTVQNLLQQAMGTTDGASPEAAGVRVIFTALQGSGGAGEVTLANQAGIMTGTAAGQPYIQYGGTGGGAPGGELGSDGLLTPGEVSLEKPWQFSFGTHTSFTFIVYVVADVPDATALFVHLTRISSSQSHSCGLTPEGKAYCWGLGLNGRLGNGDLLDRAVPTPVVQTLSGPFTQITTGTYHTCGISANGTYCWGAGASGQLGNNGNADSSVPVAVVQTLSGAFTQISAGNSHTCGIGATGAFCWGWNAAGQLGNNGSVDEWVPVAVFQLGSGVFTQISASNSSTTCGITVAGAFCWGMNDYGEIGNDGTVLRRIPTAVTQSTSGIFTQVSTGGVHSCGIAANGTYCWGAGGGRLGNNGTLGSLVPTAVVLTTSGPFTSVVAGKGSSSCGINTAGDAYCWGSGYRGQLGRNSLLDSTVPTAVTQTLSGRFTEIAPGEGYACGVASAGAFCWGWGDSYKLGTGVLFDRWVPTVVAGSIGA